MKKLYAFLFSVLLTTPIFAVTTALDVGLNASQLERIVGARGNYDANQQLLKISIPRSDLNVTINGIKLSSAMGLTSWVTFKKVNATDTALSGSLVLTEDQINQVMQTAIENHIDVVELHNHMLWESPKVMFMHIESVGDAKTLALAMNKIFAKIRESSNGNGDFPVGEIDTSVSNFDKAEIEKILGTKGATVDGVYKVSVDKQPLSIPRDDMPYVGRVNIAATFAGSSDNAVVDGDFALQEPNLQKVLMALQQAGITVVAINQRLVSDNTNFVFLHYWAIGNPLVIARGLRAALDMSQELPPKMELTKADIVTPYRPLLNARNEPEEHSGYLHVHAYIKQHTMPRFMLRSVELERPKAFKDLSIQEMFVHAFSVLKDNLIATQEADKDKSFHWTMAKPSQMVTTMWKDWSERPDVPDDEIVVTQRTIILGAPQPKQIVLHKEIGKPSEYVHKLWADISERPALPDNFLQVAIKALRRPGTQLIALHKEVGKPSQFITNLWTDFASRQEPVTTSITQSTSPVQLWQTVAKEMPPENKRIKAWVLHKDMGKPSQFVSRLWFDMTTRPIPAEVIAAHQPAPVVLMQTEVKAPVLATVSTARVKTWTLHKTMGQPSQFVSRLWFDIATRPVTVKMLTQAKPPVKPKTITLTTAVSTSHPMQPWVLHKQLGEPSQFVSRLWFDIATRPVPPKAVTMVAKTTPAIHTVSAETKVALQMTAKLTNQPVIPIHKPMLKPSQLVHHLWNDIAARRATDAGRRLVPLQVHATVRPTLTQPVTLKHLTKPSAMVHSLWQHIENRQDATPLFDKLFQHVARGNMQHMLEAQTRALQHRHAIHKTSELVHRLWQAMEINPEAKPQQDISLNKPTQAVKPAHIYLSAAPHKKFMHLAMLTQNTLFPVMLAPQFKAMPNAPVRAPAPIQHAQATPPARLTHGLPIKPLAEKKKPYVHLHVVLKNPLLHTAAAEHKKSLKLSSRKKGVAYLTVKLHHPVLSQNLHDKKALRLSMSVDKWYD